MANSTIINGTQLIKNNMAVEPTTIITIIAVFFVIFILISLGAWIWTKMNG